MGRHGGRGEREGCGQESLIFGLEFTALKVVTENTGDCIAAGSSECFLGWSADQRVVVLSVVALQHNCAGVYDEEEE